MIKRVSGIIILLCFLIISTVSAQTVSHNASQIRAGQFGQLLGGGNYSFPSSLAVGKATPNAGLDLIGNLLVTSTSESKFLSDAGADTYFYIIPDGANDVVKIGGYGGGGTIDRPLILQYAGGNVGIGTTGPGYKLDVNGTVHIAGVNNLKFDTVSGGYGAYLGNTNATLGNFKITGAMGTNDYWSIFGDGSNNTGVLHIRTGDDGTEPIYFEQNSNVRMAIDGTGNVGIGTGTNNPSAKLHVVGTFNVSNSSNTVFYVSDTTGTVTISGGSGKINVGTVDPIYTINDTNYATYLPGMTGVKEETVGIIELKKGKATIDFSTLEDGSDLWLFRKITDFGNKWEDLVVILTPSFNGKVWYEKDYENNKLIIRGDSSQGEISFKLIAPRFDHESWSNFAEADLKGLIIS